MLVLGGVVTALLVTAGAFAALVLATAPGHNLMRRWMVNALNGVVDGEVRIGSLDGALWRVADARDVALIGRDSSVILRAERIRVGYVVPDLLRGRYIVRSVTITRPVLILEQDSTGVWNLARLLRLGDTDTSAAAAPRPLVELRQVSLVDGTVIVRPWRRGAPLEYMATGVTADLSRLRASHPDSTALELDLTRLALRLAEPAVALEHAAGTVRLDGDSARFDLTGVRLPATRANASGLVRWGGERTVLDVGVTARPFAFADLRPFVPELPEEGAGQLDARVRWLASGAQEYDVRRLGLRSGRTQLGASGHLVRSPRGALAARGLALRLEPFDIAFLEPWVDSLPVRGLVRGQVRAGGALADLALDADFTFTDESLRPAPVSSVAGRGRVGWTRAGGFVIPGYDLTRSSFDLSSVRPFFRWLKLTGRAEVQGHATYARSGVTWAGALQHIAATGTSRLHGTATITLGDTVALNAEVAAESLSFDALREAYPRLPLRGAGAGRLRVEGPVRGLGLDADLAGIWGRIEGRGAVADGREALIVIGEGAFDSLDVWRHVPAAPRTRLGGVWAVALTLPKDSAQLPSGNAEIGLQPSFVEGIRVHGSAGIAFVPGRLLVDSAQLTVPGGYLRAAGALGFPGAPPGQLTYQVRLDTLAAFEPLVRWVLEGRGDSSGSRLDGSAELSGRIIGTLDAWEAEGRVGLGRAEAAGVLVRGVGGTFSVSHGPDSTGFGADTYADSVVLGGLRYAPFRIAAAGRPERFAVRGGAGFASSSSLRVALAVASDSAVRTITMDTLKLDLPVGAWALARPATVTLTADTIGVDTLLVVATEGAGRLLAHGTLPRAGEGRFTLDADSLPLADIFALLGRDTTGVGGALDVGVGIAGPAADPAIDFQVYMSEGRFGTYRAPEVQVLGAYAARVLSLKGGLWRDGERVVNLGGFLPLDLALRGVERRRLGGALQVALRTDSLDLAIFRAVTDQVRNPTGSAALDVRITGTWEEPALSGFAQFADAAMTIPALNMRYHNLDARLELEGRVIRIARAQVSSGDGTLLVGGTITFPTLDRPVLDLNAQAQRFHAFEMRDFAGLTGTGELTLAGPAIGATLAGRLTVDQGYLRFADLVEKRVVNLDDPEFRAIVDSTLAAASDLGPSFHTVFLDSLRISRLTVTLGPDVWLRSSEANIQLSGQFQTAKTVDFGVPRYRIDGTMRAVRGNYRLAFGTGNTSYLAREFRVTRGTVRFFGTPDFNPEMDIAAEHVVRRADGGGNLTVRAIIGGTLLEPRLRLESDERPPLTETELVSYLLVGRPISALTQRRAGQQFDPLRDGAMMLMGELSQALVGGIGLPLDVLTIRPGQAAGGQVGDALAGATIEAGVQVGSRTYVSLNAGLCEVRTSQAVGVAIEYQLSTQFTTQTSLEPVVRECRTGGGVLANTASRYQVGFDLFWFLGGVR